jgi:serine/threonine-protein kinase
MPTATASIFDTGSVIDEKWVLLERIGKGGMGEVYRAHQLNLKRDVAIKLISTEFLQNMEDNAQEVENLRARFEREVQTMGQVRHPNVLQIFDYGVVRHPDKGAAIPVEYIAMEYIPGNTLRFTMSEEGLEGEEDLLKTWLETYFLPVLDGVQAIHAHGIVHRDLKPENVLMDGETPKIGDFGLSRSVRMRAVSNSWDVKGTWPYMAPEQFSDFRRAGEAADIYSLGKILYEAVTGTLDPKALPFKMVSLEEPETPLEKAVDPVIRKATHEDPLQRYTSVSELRRDVVAALRETDAPPQQVVARPSTSAWMRYTWIGVIVAVISVLGMALYHLSGPSPNAPSPPAATPSPPTAAVPSTPTVADAGTEDTLLAANGRTLQRVEATGSEQLFFADRELITYHHYVEFLNEVVGQIEVADGVVKKGDEIWIYIGEGQAASEPILYIDGRFQLRSAERAPDPVVRVTWKGAQAYAAYYDLKLPTYAQWTILHRDRELSPPAETPPPTTAGDEGHTHMMGASGTMAAGGSSPPHDAGLAAAVHKEWVALPNENTRGGVADWQVDRSAGGPVRRYPWEGFDDVGFRTVFDPG